MAWKKPLTLINFIYIVKKTAPKTNQRTTSGISSPINKKGLKKITLDIALTMGSKTELIVALKETSSIEFAKNKLGVNNIEKNEKIFNFMINFLSVDP